MDKGPSSRRGTRIDELTEILATGNLMDDSENEIDVSYKQILQERWKAAVKQARRSLDGLPTNDIRILQSFKTPEELITALLGDLERKQPGPHNTWFYTTATDVMHRFVKTVNKTAGTFIMAMAPYSPKLAMFWGLVYLTMTLSLESQAKWKQFQERLEKIRQNLAFLNAICARIKDIPPEEVNTAIFDVFTSLIGFWVEAVKWMRAHNHAIDTSTVLHSEFTKSMKQVESSIQHLRNLASVENSYSANVVQAQMTRRSDMFSALDSKDDTYSVQYPVVLLPEDMVNTAFCGRDDVLAEIDEALQAPGKSAPAMRSVLLHGMGGVGKTQTALNFAKSRQRKYDIVLWIRSETPLALSSSLTQISRDLAFPDSDSPGSDERNLSSFHKWISKHHAASKTSRRWLLIYDNVPEMSDNLRRYVPVKPVDIIITSRNRRAVFQEATKLISLRTFDAYSGAKLLQKFLKYPAKQLASKADIDSTIGLAQQVGGLPLGMRHMAGLMNEREEKPAAEFLAMYVENPRELMMDAGPAVDYQGGMSRPGDEHPLDRVWTITFRSLKDAQRTLLGIISFLSPDQIPHFLFGPRTLEHTSTEGLKRICGTGYKLDGPLVGLANVALIDRASNPFAIHRLVQEAFRYWCNKDELLDHFEAAVHIVHTYFPRQVNGRPMHESWDKCRDLIQHGQILAERFVELQRRWPEIVAPTGLAELLKSCAWYLFEMADHPSTLKMLDIAIAACPDKQSELYAHLLNTIGCCSFELGNLRRCRTEWNKALEIRETWAKRRVFGAEEELANQLNNYGNLESAQGQYDSALAYFDRAKQIRLRLGDEAIVPLGVTHMTTGRAYFLKGEYKEALYQYKSAADIFIKKFGADSHFMAHLNYAYGNLEFAREDHQKAREFYHKARQILETDTPYHLLLTACLYKLACLFELANDRNSALDLLEKGLAIAEFRGAKGDVARIVRKKVAILMVGSEVDRKVARVMNRQVQEIVLDYFPDTVYVEDGDTEEDSDAWVCPYWR